MFTGVDYILYTQKKQEMFVQEMKKSFSLWDNPYFVIDNEDKTTDIYVAKNKIMFDLMDEKGFYTNRGSGEGPFLLIFNSNYTSDCNRITLVLPKDIEMSEFARRVFDWLKSILQIITNYVFNPKFFEILLLYFWEKWRTCLEFRLQHIRQAEKCKGKRTFKSKWASPNSMRLSEKNKTFKLDKNRTPVYKEDYLKDENGIIYEHSQLPNNHIHKTNLHINILK